MDLLELVSFLSIVINTFIILFTSTKLSSIGIEGTDYNNLVLYIFIMEHLVFGFKFLLAEAIPDVPEWVTVEERKMKHRVDQIAG